MLSQVWLMVWHNMHVIASDVIWEEIKVLSSLVNAGLAGHYLFQNLGKESEYLIIWTFQIIFVFQRSFYRLYRL